MKTNRLLIAIAFSLTSSLALSADFTSAFYPDNYPTGQSGGRGGYNSTERHSPFYYGNNPGGQSDNNPPLARVPVLTDKQKAENAERLAAGEREAKKRYDQQMAKRAAEGAKRSSSYGRGTISGIAKVGAAATVGNLILRATSDARAEVTPVESLCTETPTEKNPEPAKCKALRDALAQKKAEEARANRLAGGSK